MHQIKTISISLYDRPDYTEIVLNHLNLCHDIENYDIIICCEPKNEQVINLAKNFRQNQTNVIINSNIYGCNKNIYQCLELGFEHNDFHIHIEDDTVPGKDFLLYCQYLRSLKNDSNIFSISGYTNSNNRIEQYFPQTNAADLFSSRNWFTPWGWATWQDRWLEIKESIKDIIDTKTVSWDLYVNQIRQDRLEIFPLVSRIQNIGAINGTFCPSPEWHKENQYNEYWIESDKNYQTIFLKMDKI
jgi:hypothetical protein